MLGGVRIGTYCICGKIEWCEFRGSAAFLSNRKRGSVRGSSKHSRQFPRCDRMLRKAVVFRKPLTTQVKRYGDGWVQRNVNIFPSKIRREMGVRWKQRIPGQSNASCCSASIRVPDSLSGHPHGREKWAARLSFSPITTLDQIDNVPPAYTHYESQVFER